jgi:TolA-binding protein
MRRLLFPFLALCVSCVTLTRHQVLEDKVSVLERRIAELEDEKNRNEEKMERLHKDLQEATEALRLKTAGVSEDTDALKLEVARLKGVDEEVLYKIAKIQEDLDLIKKTLEDKLGTVLVPLPAGLQGDAKSLLKGAEDAMAKGDFRVARAILQRFLDTYKDDELAPKAQHLLGETYFREGKYQQAVREFQRVYDRYKTVKGAPVEPALLRIAQSLLKMGECAKSKEVLKFLVDYNKKAQEAGEAQKMLKSLPKGCK